ncbi:MAG: SUMF1/EgtB/PvdO family nonheme iron enzyme [Anaerolineales bacterium]|nr:SUMF1/EgtB/PvdO family nonheme iron enzyme [Anaerolineales bacterium]
MDQFTADYLTNLAAELSANIIPYLTSSLKSAFVGSEPQQAFNRALEVGLIALLAAASGAEPDEVDLLDGIFRTFFKEPMVARELANLLRGYSLDMDEMRHLFDEAGFEAATLPRLDFATGMQAFQGAFLLAAVEEPELNHIMQPHRILRQMDFQENMLEATRTLVAALAEVPRQLRAVQAGQLLAEGQPVYRFPLQVAGNVHGPIVTGNKNTISITNYYYDRRELPAAVERTRLEEEINAYIRWLNKQTSTITLRGIDLEGRPVVNLPLDKIYVPLQAVAYRRAGEQEEPLLAQHHREPQAIQLNDLLSMGERLVVTGGPGCGKSTVLLHMAWTLTEAWQKLDSGAFAAGKIHWPANQPLPLPILIPLSEYATYLDELYAGNEKPVPPDKIKLSAFISYHLGMQYTDFQLPEDFFTRLLRAGQPALLLLDGLDEVPEEKRRVEVRAAIEQLADSCPQLRMVVTCRTAAFVGKTTLAKDFAEVQVQPLGEAEVAALVTQAYGSLYGEGTQQQREKRDDLLAGITQLEAERQQRLGERAERLVTSPLLVRMLIIVHTKNRRLPDQRAALFKETVDAILHPPHPNERVAFRLAEQIGGSVNEHRALVQYLAFHMHERGEQQGREIDEAGLEAILHGSPRYGRLAEPLLQLTQLRGTLLEERNRSYRFIHLSFQEFLVARYFAEVLRDLDKIAEFLEAGPLLDSWWREPALLVSGYLSVTQPDVAVAFLQRLAGIDDQAEGRNGVLPPEIQIAAAEVAGTSVLEWQGENELLRAAVATRLAALVSDPMQPTGAVLRAKAGRTLSQLGDPREGVGSYKREDGLLLPDIAWGKTVPAGAYRIGEGKQRREVAITEAYQLSRYPVTLAQFSCFVQAADFDDPRWWEGMPEAEEAYGTTYKLRELSEQAFAYANHPRERVSWYQAVAFCRWLNDKLKDGTQINLPHEDQWEVAARYQSDTTYPWGNEFDSAKANTGEGDSVEQTTAIGLYPAGKQPHLDLYDLSGNVWEWCRNKFGDPAMETPDRSGDGRALRGGSWSLSQNNVRSSYRNVIRPHYRSNEVGFRVVRVVAHLIDL